MQADRAIRYAAAFVLAGCASNTPASTPDDKEVKPPPAPPPTVVIAAPAPAPPPAPPPPPPAIVATQGQRTPQEACQAYKDKVAGTKEDPRKMAALKPKRRRGGGIPAQAVRGLGRPNGDVQCTIVWERELVDVEVTITPTCCPRARMGNHKCPPSYKAKRKGQKGIVEHVSLAGDETKNRRVERWVIEPQIPRHMCGRRPEGFEVAGDAAGRAPGDVLASMAVLEAASVPAFARLARELESHGAPQALVDRAREAMRDEVRHANSLRRLARARGAEPASWRRAPLEVRPLLELAIENAVEGCVREAFGAAIAVFQGARAGDDEVRDVFAGIADDECRHAALAWDVHHWFMTRASDEEKRAVLEAQQHALASIEHLSTDEPARRALGLPTPKESEALLATMATQLGLAA